MSLGDGVKYTAPCSSDATNPFLTPITNAYSAGISSVIASGNNQYLDGLSNPACTPNAISVGAVYDSNLGSISYTNLCTDSTTVADKVTCFSNSASFLTLLAPGALITAGGSTQAGTSQAAPHVAGAVAVLRSKFTDTLSQMLTRLTRSGAPVLDARNGITKPRLNLSEAARADLAAYSFDNTTSLAMIAKDDTGHGYDGVLPSTGATSVPGKIGSALNFLPDNNVQEFSVQSSSAITALNVLEEMTGIAWVKPMGTQSPDGNASCTQGTIFSKGGSYSFQLSQNNKQIHFQNEGSGTELAIANYPANGGAFPLNQWTQIAFVRGPWDAITQTQSIQLYVNGDPVPTTTGGPAGTVDGYLNNNSPVGPNALLNPAASNTSPLMVGNYGFLNDTGACEFNGDIDAINLYDAALSAAEIKSQPD